MRAARDTLNPEVVLAVFDHAAGAMTFPMLDNGYVYLAAARLTVFSDAEEWSVVIETFGFSPRAGLPDISLITMGSTIANAKTATDFVNDDAFAQHIRTHPNDETYFAWPLEDGDWIDGEDTVPGRGVVLRGRSLRMPDPLRYESAGIQLARPPGAAVFEFARWLAHAYRQDVLAAEIERRLHVPAGLPQVLRLDEWRHPDLVNDELPSQVETFREIALVAATGDPLYYQTTETPNSHWANWPLGGTL